MMLFASSFAWSANVADAPTATEPVPSVKGRWVADEHETADVSVQTIRSEHAPYAVLLEQAIRDGKDWFQHPVQASLGASPPYDDGWAKRLPGLVVTQRPTAYAHKGDPSDENDWTTLNNHSNLRKVVKDGTTYLAYTSDRTTVGRGISRVTSRVLLAYRAKKLTSVYVEDREGDHSEWSSVSLHQLVWDVDALVSMRTHRVTQSHYRGLGKQQPKAEAWAATSQFVLASSDRATSGNGLWDDVFSIRPEDEVTLGLGE